MRLARFKAGEYLRSEKFNAIFSEIEDNINSNNNAGNGNELDLTEINNRIDKNTNDIEKTKEQLIELIKKKSNEKNLYMTKIVKMPQKKFIIEENIKKYTVIKKLFN